MTLFRFFSSSRVGCRLDAILVGAGMLLASPAGAETSPVAGGEYYFDADPGQGQGTPLGAPPAITAPTTLSLPLSATAGLSPGVHTVSVRWRDAEGRWGAPATTQFLKLGVDEFVPATLTKLEYFFGADPGPGQGVAVDLPAEAADMRSFTLPAASSNSLPDGVHTVSVRYQDSRGAWGAPATAVFLKTTEPSTTLARLEWEWWKGDDFPQRQAGAPLEVAPAAATAELALRLPGGELTPGDQITVRVWWVNADGEPGPPATFVWTVLAHQAAWVAHYFTAEEAANPAVAGPEADPEGDGVPNLLEQAFGNDPHRAEPEAAPSLIRDPSTPLEVAFHFQRLSGGTTQPDGAYRRGPYAYTLEELVTPAAGDFLWQPLPPDAVTLESTGPATTEGFEAVSARLPVTAGAPTRIIRLKVTHTAP